MGNRIEELGRLLEEYSPSHIEIVNKRHGLWNYDFWKEVKDNGVLKKRLRFPIKLILHDIGVCGYFSFQQDLKEFLYKCKEFPWDLDYFITVYRMLDVWHIDTLNEIETDYFKNDLGDKTIEGLGTEVVAGNLIYLQPTSVISIEEDIKWV